MAVLSFKVQADYEKVVRLREEIAKLETQLKGVGKNTPDSEIKELERKLSDAKREFMALATEAAKAGSAMDKKFKADIRSASKEVDAFTAKIIEQKAVVKNVEFDVKRLGEAYSKALLGKNTGRATELKADLDAARRVLDEEKAALFGLTQEKAKASLETKKLKDEYAAFKEEAGEAVKANEGFHLSLGKVAGLIGGATALKQLASQIVSVRGQFQDMETAIETLVGKDMAGKLMPQIKEMAKISPLTMTDIVGAEKMMLGFNIEAEKTIDYLKAISDVSMGNSQKFNSLTLAFSQMSAAGRLMGQDLNQMINAGFNPLQVISEKTGKSIAQLKEEMSKGAVSAQMVQQAFLDATSAGGKFYNMSENASKTINGQISMMQDAMDAVFNEIGTKTEGVIIKGIQTATSLIQNYEKIGKVLVGLVATYGAYRTAVLLSTAATSKHTIAEIALTNVRIAARKAQQALNAAMMTNPYVALATVVAGLAASMWALRDNTTAAEKAQKNYDAMKEQAAQKEKEHADAIQGLIDKVRDETQAESERVLALMALKNEYPNIFAQYDIEKLKLADILQLQKQINEENAKRKKTANEGSLAQYDKDIAKAEEDIRNAPNMGAGSLARLAEAQKRLEALKASRDALLNDMKQTSIAEFTGSLASKSLEELQEYQKNLEANTFKLDGEAVDSSTRDALQKFIKEAIEKMNKATALTYSDEYKAAKKEWNEAKKALESIEKDKDKYTTKQYEAAKARKETAEKNFKKLGGDPKGKAETDTVKAYNEQLAQQERVRQAQERSDRERARTAKDMEFMVEQARISAMQEGAEKKRAQRELDNRKELEDLERQKQDYIDKTVEAEKAIFDAQEEQKAKNNSKYKRQTFDAEAAKAKVDTKAYDAAIAFTVEKQKSQQDEVLKDLLERYKSYEDKKQEIIISYLNESDELQAMYEETGDERYQRSLDERHKAYVKALNDLEKEMNTADYKLIFGDPSRMTGETIEKALDAARKKLAELDKEADPETFQALSEAIERLENARDNNPFQGWDTSVMGLIQKLHQIRNIRKDIAKYEKEGNKEASEASEAELKRAKKDLTKALIGTGVSQFGDALSLAASSMRQVAEASGDIELERLAKTLETTGSIVSSVASGAASGGWVGAIVGGLSSAFNAITSAVTESKVAVAELKKAYEDYGEEISRMARQIDSEDYETIFGTRITQKLADAARNANKAREDYEAAMAKEYGNKQSGRGYTSGLENMKTSVPAERGGGYASLREAFPEIFEYEKDERGLLRVAGLKLEEAKVLLETYKGTEAEASAWYESLKAAVEALEDYEANMKEIDSYLSSMFSSLGDELADAIMKGDDALEVLKENAGDIFASIAKQLVAELIISDEFIKKYKERWRSAIVTSDYQDDADVIKEMTDELVANIEGAKDFYEQIKKAAEERGIDMSFSGSESQQEASRKGYETLSEDTGNELVGRALAQYESNLRIEEAARSTKETVDLMAANQVHIRDIAAESRALIADSYLELQQIRENTGAIIRPIKNLSDKMDKWDNKIMGL